MFFLELKPILKCNQKCYYCDVFGKSMFEDSDAVVDIDFLKFVLDCHKNAELTIQISGGEIGLLKNLSEFFDTICSYSNVKQIGIESNGLLRKNGFDFNSIPNSYYYEHLIFDIVDKEVKTFYDLDFNQVNDNHRFVIVTTEKTIDSLLKNCFYFEENGFFDKKFWYKIIVPKSYDIKFLDKLYEFYTRLDVFQDSKWELFRLYGELNEPCNERSLAIKEYCAINPPQPFVDFERKQLVHCGVVSERAARFPFTQKNAINNMSCQLFKMEAYCIDCHVYDYSKNKMKCILKSMRGNFCNRSYINDTES